MFEIFCKTDGLTKQQLDVHLPQMDISHSKFIRRMATQFAGECSALFCVCSGNSATILEINTSRTMCRIFSFNYFPNDE